MSYPGITNHVVKIPGSTAIAYLAVRDCQPNTWVYSLWAEPFGSLGEELISTGDFWAPDGVTPEQAGRIAFLLDVEYAPKHVDYPHHPGTLYDCGPCEDIMRDEIETAERGEL